MKLFSYHAALAIIIALCSGVIATLLNAETPHGRVAGTLLTAESGVPLAAKIVTLVPVDDAHARSYAAITDQRGHFAFRHVPVGSYRLIANTKAHQQPTEHIEVLEGQTTAQTFELQPQQPFLRIFANQQVFTTREAPKLRCHGFTPDNQLSVTVYRVTLNAALRGWHGYLPAALTTTDKNLQQADLHAIPELSQVSNAVQQIGGRDAEGVFREEIPLGKLPPGMYLVSIEATKQRAVTVLTVTDLGFVVKASSREALIYALDIGSGDPIAGAVVDIRQGEKTLVSGVTGADGLLSLALPANREHGDLEVIGHAGPSLATTNLDLYQQENGEALRVYTYTDRPVYRPGHTVYFKSIMRQLQGENYRVPPTHHATVRVVDGHENISFSHEYQTNAFGSLAGQFALSENAIPGTYTLTITTDEGSFDTNFSVAEYRKPEFEVTVKPARARYTRGETINADISARYYYGAPVPNAKVDYYVTRAQYWYYAPGEAWDDDLSAENGQEAQYDEGYGEGEMITSGSGQTDGNGHLTIRIPSQMKEQGDEKAESADQDWRYTIHATVTDASKRGEEGSAPVLVTQGEFRLETELDDWVAKPGQPVGVTIRAVDYNGKPVPGVRGVAELARSKWQGGTEHFESAVTQAWQADAGGVAHITVTPRRTGDYRILLKTSDPRGNRISRAQYLWVMSDEYSSFDYPYQELEVKADKTRYREGETAQIMVNTRYAPQTALLTIEGMNIKEHRLVRLQGKSTLVSVKIKPEYMPSVRASLCFIKGKHMLSGEAILNVSRERKALRVEVTPEKPNYQPGERATFRVRTLTPDGTPAPAEVSLGVVDEAIYAIEPDNTPNIAAYFYPKRIEGVQTAFSFPEVYLSGDDKAGSTIRTRRFFPDTSFWNPTIVTDSSGNAAVTFTMPDNLTTWRATVRAADMETRVGQATASTIVSKPFLVRLEAPRFFTQGDKVMVAAVAHNLTKQALDATLGLDARDFTVRGDRTAHCRIAPGQTERVAWEVIASRIGSLPVRVWAKGGSYADAMALTLPVLPKGRPRAVMQSSVVLGTENVPVEIRQDCIPGTQQLTIRLTPSLASAMLSSLDYLASYPYGCAEQTMSSFLPDIVLLQLMQQEGIDNPGLRQRLPKMVESGLLRLYGYQHADGGWHWWEYDNTDPWMTAYVVYGLLQARNAGFTVTPRVLDNGLSALLRMAGENTPIDPNTRVYMAYVLAQAGHDDVATTIANSYLGPQNAARLAQLSDWGRGMLALSLKTLKRADDGKAVLAPLWRHFSDSGYYPQAGSRWSADTEQAAVLLTAASELTPNDARLPALVRWLFRQRQDDHWYSTRDTAFVLYGLSRYMQVTHELQPDMRAVVRLGGQVVAEKHFTKADVFQPEYTLTLDAQQLARYAPGQQRFTVALEKSGQGRLYYTTALQQVAAENLLTPIRNGAGLVIERQYRKLDLNAQHGGNGNRDDQQTTYNSGDVIEVTLTVRAMRDFDYLLVEDMLPAGCEVSDRGPLETWEWENWWCEQVVRDQNVSFAIRHLSPGVNRITYRMVAQIPGQYMALPPQIYDMYNPAMRGDGVGAVITIR